MNSTTSPDDSDAGIENQLKLRGKIAPRVTPQDLEAAIVDERYFSAADGVDGADIRGLRELNPTDTVTLAELESDPDPMTTPMGTLTLMTLCVLVLKNGFKLVGQSSCVHPDTFDAEIGKRLARADAVRQMWPLLGYALMETL